MREEIVKFMCDRVRYIKNACVLIDGIIRITEDYFEIKCGNIFEKPMSYLVNTMDVKCIIDISVNDNADLRVTVSTSPVGNKESRILGTFDFYDGGRKGTSYESRWNSRHPYDFNPNEYFNELRDFGRRYQKVVERTMKQDKEE